MERGRDEETFTVKRISPTPPANQRAPAALDGRRHPLTNARCRSHNSLPPPRPLIPRSLRPSTGAIAPFPVAPVVHARLPHDQAPGTNSTTQMTWRAEQPRHIRKRQMAHERRYSPKHSNVLKEARSLIRPRLPNLCSQMSPATRACTARLPYHIPYRKACPVSWAMICCSMRNPTPNGTALSPLTTTTHLNYDITAEFLEGCPSGPSSTSTLGGCRRQTSHAGTCDW